MAVPPVRGLAQIALEWVERHPEIPERIAADLMDLSIQAIETANKFGYADKVLTERFCKALAKASTWAITTEDKLKWIRRSTAEMAREYVDASRVFPFRAEEVERLRRAGIRFDEMTGYVKITSGELGRLEETLRRSGAELRTLEARAREAYLPLGTMEGIAEAAVDQIHKMD